MNCTTIAVSPIAYYNYNSQRNVNSLECLADVGSISPNKGCLCFIKNWIVEINKLPINQSEFLRYLRRTMQKRRPYNYIPQPLEKSIISSIKII